MNYEHDLEQNDPFRNATAEMANIVREVRRGSVSSFEEISDGANQTLRADVIMRRI